MPSCLLARSEEGRVPHACMLSHGCSWRQWACTKSSGLQKPSTEMHLGMIHVSMSVIRIKIGQRPVSRFHRRAVYGLRRRALPCCRNEHHLCTEPECEYCFVAYATPEELRQHRLQVGARSRLCCPIMVLTYIAARQYKGFSTAAEMRSSSEQPHCIARTRVTVLHIAST